jgi:acyl carrier protein
VSATDDLYHRIAKAFAMVFDDMPAQLGPTTDNNDIPDWDSVSHVSLVLALESEFGVKFTSAEIQAMGNVGKVAELILRAQQRR